MGRLVDGGGSWVTTSPRLVPAHLLLVLGPLRTWFLPHFFSSLLPTPSPFLLVFHHGWEALHPLVACVLDAQVLSLDL
jgi:hypothetical protein